MILDNKVQIRVNNKIAKIYQDKGYDIPYKIGSKNKPVFDTSKYITIDIKDLETSSAVIVNTACDICKEQKKMPYREYIRQLDENGLRTCIKCKTIKSKKTIQKKYGENYENVSQLDFVKDKKIKTNLNHFGCNWGLGSPRVQEKIKHTNTIRYGYESALKNEKIKEKLKETNLKRYGVENPMQLTKHKEKLKETMIKKYGYSCTMHIPEIRKRIEETNLKRYNCRSSLGSNKIREKSIQTKFKNNSVPTSTQQIYICNLYNGILNYPCSYYNLDICFDNLDIEYDGSGHELTVTLGKIKKHDFDVKQIIRDKIVKSYGYKIIRYISNTDKLPDDNVLLNILDYSRNYFESTNHTWIEWYFDENKYRNAENMNGHYYNFGLLKKIKVA